MKTTLFIATLAISLTLTSAITLRANNKLNPHQIVQQVVANHVQNIVQALNTPFGDSAFLKPFENQIVYIQTLRSGFEGKYLSYKKNKNDKRNARFLNEHQDNLIASPRFKWKIRFQDDYFTMENQDKRGYYVRSADKDSRACRVTESFSPQSDSQYLWIAKGNENNFQMQNKAKRRYGYAQSDGDLALYDSPVRGYQFKIYTPPIEEFDDVVAILDNPDNAGYTYSVSITIGISTTTTVGVEITTEVEAEVSAGIARAASKNTISASWSQSQTYESAVTESHEFTVGQGRWEVRQLKASYGHLNVGSSSYGVYRIGDS